MSRFHANQRTAAACRAAARAVVTIVAIVTTAPLAVAADAPADRHEVLSMLPGLVEPRETVQVASPSGGPLRQLLVREGQDVEQEQVLAVFDNRVAAAAVRLAEAAAAREGAVQRAEAEVAAAEGLLARVAQARAERAASELEHDQARNGLAMAQAALVAAREQHAEAQCQLELERARLEALYVRAPFAGRVLRIEHAEGDTILPGHPVMTVVNLARLRVELHVPLEWFGKLEAGRSYLLAADAPLHRAIAAELVYQEPVVDAATKSFRCVLEIDNATGELPSGFSARLIRPAPPLAAASSPAPISSTSQVSFPSPISTGDTHDAR